MCYSHVYSTIVPATSIASISVEFCFTQTVFDDTVLALVRFNDVCTIHTRNHGSQVHLEQVVDKLARQQVQYHLQRFVRVVLVVVVKQRVLGFDFGIQFGRIDVAEPVFDLLTHIYKTFQV